MTRKSVLLNLLIFVIITPFSYISAAKKVGYNFVQSQEIRQESDSTRAKRKLLLRDERKNQLSYLDLADPKKSWNVSIPAGRDIQLVGKGRVLIGTGNGFEERDIATGNKVNELTSYKGTISARRLRNGNTLLVGVNVQDKEGIVLTEVDHLGEVKRHIVYPGFTYARLVRETTDGTFLVSADNIVLEGDAQGNILWKANLVGRDHPHAWQPIRLPNKQTVISGGYTANLQFFDSTGSLIKTIGGPEKVNPNFYAGLQILPSGNLVVINWQGHGPDVGEKGIQLLEYSPEGELVWFWKQDPSVFSSLHGVIVLDGLDLNLLHVEDERGVLVPVKVK